jgi:hypothetical protein
VDAVRPNRVFSGIRDLPLSGISLPTMSTIKLRLKCSGRASWHHKALLTVEVPQKVAPVALEQDSVVSAPQSQDATLARDLFSHLSPPVLPKCPANPHKRSHSIPAARGGRRPRPHRSGHPRLRGLRRLLNCIPPPLPGRGPPTSSVESFRGLRISI